MRNDGTHIQSEQETNGNVLLRMWMWMTGFIFTCMNRFRFKRVGKKFWAPYPISVVNGQNMILGDDVYLGRHCRLYAFPAGELVIGNRVSIDHDVEIRGGRHLVISDDVRIVKGATLKCGNDHHLVIGARTLISEGCILNGDIRIGEDVIFGPRVFLNAFDHGFKNRHAPINQQASEGGTIVIENNVWLGYNVSVLKRVRIGEGAIVGTNGVVTKNVVPYTIVVGIPAKAMKVRE